MRSLWRVSANGGGGPALTRAARDVAPSVSPDGRRSRSLRTNQTTGGALTAVLLTAVPLNGSALNGSAQVLAAAMRRRGRAANDAAARRGGAVVVADGKKIAFKRAG